MQKEKKNMILDNYFVGLEKVYYILQIFYPVIDYNGFQLIQKLQNLRLITMGFLCFSYLLLTKLVKLQKWKQKGIWAKII